MATDIKMPQLGESVTEGTISRWLKQPGERVEKYEALLEVTTDKVDTEVPAPATGIVREIAVPEGTTVRVGTLLAVLDDEGAQSAEHRAQSDQVSAGNGQDQGSNAQTLERSNAFVSPVVARLVAEHNLDVGKINGSGQGGRVTKQDVLKHIESHKNQPSRIPVGRRSLENGGSPPAPADSSPSVEPTRAAPPAPASVSSVPASVPSVEPELPDDAEIIPLSPMRRSIAEHMLRSRQIAPHVTTVFEVDVSQIVAHRERRKAEFERQGVKLTYTPYFVQAAVAGLQAVPIVNGSYAESGVVLHQRIHVGVAVALEEGLIVPVIRDADEKNLLGLARAVGDLSGRARSRRLKPDETQGGTFTITNHGVGGSLFATPIINQPQAAILGIGAIQKRAVVMSQAGVDAIAIRPMCYLSLTIDHRLLDGATADLFLTAIKGFLEGYAE
jgi:2-oxoglutarate dehydrogenase E2 component (dihydrolipoamide succinyltransferase)